MTPTASILKSEAEFEPLTLTFNSREDIDAFIEAQEDQVVEEKFESATITFDSEADLHDVLAALGAYHDKKRRVVDTNTAPKFGLDKYTGNARATVRRLLPKFLAELGIDADTTQLTG